MVIALVHAGRASKGGTVVDRHNNRGFTLIEVMVVVVILAILAAIALPSYANYVARSKIRTAQADLRALSAALENHRQRTLLYPVGAPANTKEVMDDFPAWNPAAKSVDFGFSANSDANGYTLTASGASGKLSGCTLTLAHDGTTGDAGCLAGW